MKDNKRIIDRATDLTHFCRICGINDGLRVPLINAEQTLESVGIEVEFDSQLVSSV